MMSPIEVLAPAAKRVAAEPRPDRGREEAPSTSWELDRIRTLFGTASLHGRKGGAAPLRGIDPFILRRFRFGG